MSQEHEKVRRKVYSSHVVTTTNQDENTEKQLKEFRQLEPMLVLAKWLGHGELSTAADILSSTIHSFTSSSKVYTLCLSWHLFKSSSQQHSNSTSLEKCREQVDACFCLFRGHPFLTQRGKACIKRLTLLIHKNTISYVSIYRTQQQQPRYMYPLNDLRDRYGTQGRTSISIDV